ncbi:ACT domain-containing protein [Roseibium sp.]|uniref:ACT domain-containing protein n=1 Tax=Roseibium sp. TaxID=1936156 RepID=UPI003A976290
MSGETDLQTLIAHMRPVLDPEPYVFCTFAERSLEELVSCDPLALIAEPEGTTAILSADMARQHGLPAKDPFQRISLTVHSSLEAVGLTAAVSTALAEAGIPANVVAAFFHDHVFVPEAQADKAMTILKSLSETRA